MSTNRRERLESSSRLALNEWGEDGLQDASLVTSESQKGRLSLKMLLNPSESESESSGDELVRSTANFYGNISGAGCYLAYKRGAHRLISA
jgi:hypothetical protein